MKVQKLERDTLECYHLKSVNRRKVLELFRRPCSLPLFFLVDNGKIKYWFNAKHTFHCTAPLDSSEAAQIEAISGDSPNYYKLATSRRCRGTDDIDADDSFMQSFEMLKAML